MTTLHIAYRVAYGFPGGVAGLAAIMDKGTQVLTNKLNPNSTTHHLTVFELEMLADFTNSNLSFAEYFAQKAGAVVVPLPALDEVMGDMTLLDAFMDASSKAGEFAKEFSRAWADGRVTQAEFAQIKNTLFEQIASQLATLAKIEQVVR